MTRKLLRTALAWSVFALVLPVMVIVLFMAEPAEAG